MDTVAKPMANMGAQLDKRPNTTHYSRDQWVWWETNQVADGWQVRIGYLEDPVGDVLEGYMHHEAAKAEGSLRSGEMLAARQTEIATGFHARKFFKIGGTGINCRPNASDPGWHVGANNHTLYGRGVYFGHAGQDRNNDEQLEDFEDACMECAVALRQSRERDIRCAAIALTPDDLKQLASMQVDVGILGEAMAAILPPTAQTDVLDRYNEILKGRCTDA